MQQRELPGRGVRFYCVMRQIVCRERGAQGAGLPLPRPGSIGANARESGRTIGGALEADE
jgi:hypothetical protein